MRGHFENAPRDRRRSPTTPTCTVDRLPTEQDYKSPCPSHSPREPEDALTRGQYGAPTRLSLNRSTASTPGTARPRAATRANETSRGWRRTNSPATSASRDGTAPRSRHPMRGHNSLADVTRSSGGAKSAARARSRRQTPRRPSPLCVWRARGAGALGISDRVALRARRRATLQNACTAKAMPSCFAHAAQLVECRLGVKPRDVDPVGDQREARSAGGPHDPPRGGGIHACALLSR
jgi:hypothetical protein